MINLVPQKQYYNEDGTIYVPQAADGLGSKGRSIVTGEELGLEPVLNYFDPQNVGFFTKTERRSDPNNRFSPIVTEYEWNPSKYDFSDLNLIKAPGGIAFQDRAIYENKDGIQLEYRPSTDTFLTPYTSDQLRDFQQNNPNQYNTILANNISEKIFGNWASNRNDLNQPLYDRLESFKEKTPEAYYTGKINLLSKQMGWNHGQNTFERAVPLQQELEKLIPEAQKVGVSQTEINNLYSGGFSEASFSNQNRIAREPGGFKLSELIRGVAPVAALAIGGPLIDAALTGAAAASTAGTAGTTGTIGGTGATTGAGWGTLGSAGSVGTAPGVLSTTGGAGWGTFGSAGLAGTAPGVLSTTGGAGWGTLGSAGGTAVKPFISPTQAIQGLRMASGLLSGEQQQQQQPQQQMVQMPQQSIIPRGQVDYSGIYNLLNLQKAANPYSLLG